MQRAAGGGCLDLSNDETICRRDLKVELWVILKLFILNDLNLYCGSRDVNNAWLI